MTQQDRERAEEIQRAFRSAVSASAETRAILGILASVRTEERERCAKIAEASGEKSKWGSEYELACIQIAERIRAEEESRG